MDSNSEARILDLEEEVKNLSNELTQCQADKEFVWSLWKRLQVANPDLTQAVSLVVEREKHKTEIKDRKVLEILQCKDYMIQELEQKVKEHKQEIDNLLQKRTTVEEEGALKKEELKALQEHLTRKSQELEEMKTKSMKKEEEEQQVVHALEKEKEGLMSCCAALRADLEEKQQQVNSQQDQKNAAQARLKDLEKDLHNTLLELSTLQRHSNDLQAQLTTKEREVATKEEQLHRLCCDFADVQTLYRQSSEHAAEQSHLIKQLEVLNLDTQRVLRNQEEAHTADTTSYQRLYKELSQCYQALVMSESKLRQSHQELRSQLADKDQLISQLQAQLQKQQEQIQHPQQQQQQQAQHVTLYSSSNKQTNFKALVVERADAENLGSHTDQASTTDSDLTPEDKNFHPRSARPVRRQQGTPVQRSRSLSPASSVVLGSGSSKGAEQRIQDLEELLRLKTKENEELGKAHKKRRERMCLIQNYYKTVRDQLKEIEKSSGLASLEEELDILRVQSAMDRATVKELHICLTKEQQELLYKMAEEQQVKSSTPKKPPLSSGRMDQSFKKIEQLEHRMFLLEEQNEKLRDEKEQLLEANKDLAHSCRRLHASADHQRVQEAVREEAALAQEAQHRGDIMALEVQLGESKKEIARLHHQLLKLRQELGILRAARDFYRNRAAGPTRTTGNSTSINNKVKFKATRRRRLLHPHSHQTVSPNQATSWQGRSPSPTKDEWEDMSIDSYSGEEFSDSLNRTPSRAVLHRQPSTKKSYRCSSSSNLETTSVGSNRRQPHVLAQGSSTRFLLLDDKQHEPWDRGTGGEKRRWRKKRMLMKSQRCSTSSLQQRVESLQRHIDILRSARKDALLSARELRRANEMITSQLNTLTEKLHSSKQQTQKLTSDLAGVEQQKKVLEMELEQWKRITLPPQTSSAALVNTECHGKTLPASANLGPKSLEAEVKQLQGRLKSVSAEVTRQMAANKALHGQLQEKEEKLCQLQDKMNHTERDVHMKRQLVEDLKTRLKFLQEMEKSYRGQVEELEKKVKALSEEGTNRKSFIESLKRRLNVATTEKSQCEDSCAKLKEGLGKKEQRIQALQSHVAASEAALAALEKTAHEQMEGLTLQSSNTIAKLQRQLGQISSHLEQLHCFIKTLASEILLEVQEVKQQLMNRRKLKQASSMAARNNLSAKSMIKAKSVAASILNMSENDLADIMEPDQTTEGYGQSSRDQEWLDHLNLILQQKIPTASQLMQAVRVKMKERKVLTEELAALTTPVSEKP
ncbi:centlein isoform X3 [Oryzias latipes]|uniref:Centlein, centrosomal protein n=1 Tax=Oryzias latipes TaxID=8090 RepID=H2LSA1_ORYLA|nr:centlein isoform X3 [Oryzias latipes]